MTTNFTFNDPTRTKQMKCVMWLRSCNCTLAQLNKLHKVRPTLYEWDRPEYTSQLKIGFITSPEVKKIIFNQISVCNINTYNNQDH